MRAAGPCPMMRSTRKSSIAGYSTSSTAGCSRWISSRKKTSRDSNEVRMAVRSPLRSSSGPALERKGDLTAILTSLESREVFFLDEIHRLQPAVEEVLYPAMEDFRVDLIIGQGPGARIHPFSLGHFTLIGATTRAGLITAPLRSRFGIVHRLDFYQPEDLLIILRRSSKILNIQMEEGGAEEIAGRCRGTPRIANRLLRRARDFAEVRARGE